MRQRRGGEHITNRLDIADEYSLFVNRLSMGHNKEITDGIEFIEHLEQRLKDNPFFHLTGCEAELEYMKQHGVEYVFGIGYGGEFMRLWVGEKGITLPLHREEIEHGTD